MTPDLESRGHGDCIPFGAQDWDFSFTVPNKYRYIADDTLCKAYVFLTLNNISLASFLWNIGKQNSPKLDAAKRGVPSGLAHLGLFCSLF